MYRLTKDLFKIIRTTFSTSSYYEEKAIVLEEKKLAYLPLSKVANTSIKNCLTVGLSKDVLGDFALQSEKEKMYAVHRLSWNRIPTNTVPKDYYYFTFVRNPFDRLVSCYKSKLYNDKKMGRPSYLSTYYMMGSFSKEMSFEAFVDMIITIPDKYAEAHFKSQYAEIKDIFDQIDYIGKFEDLPDSLDSLVEKFDLGVLQKMNKTSKSSKEYQKRYTSSDLVEKVYKRYSDDVHKLLYYKEYEELLSLFS